MKTGFLYYYNIYCALSVLSSLNNTVKMLTPMSCITYKITKLESLYKTLTHIGLASFYGIKTNSADNNLEENQKHHQSSVKLEMGSPIDKGRHVHSA